MSSFSKQASQGSFSWPSLDTWEQRTREVKSKLSERSALLNEAIRPFQCPTVPKFSRAVRSAETKAKGQHNSNQMTCSYLQGIGKHLNPLLMKT